MELIINRHFYADNVCLRHLTFLKGRSSQNVYGELSVAPSLARQRLWVLECLRLKQEPLCPKTPIIMTHSPRGRWR